MVFLIIWKSTWLPLIVMMLLGAAVHGRLLFVDFDSPNTVAHYAQLLNHQHIVMIGDSLMRYQYLALSYLVHTHTLVSPEARPSILLEGSYHSWQEFYRDAGIVLFPNEYCDCYRAETKEQDKNYENRYYHDAARNISLTFLFYSGDALPTRGHWHPGDADDNHHYRAADNESIPAKWEYEHVEDVITNVAAKLTPKPSTLILNAGHWVNYYHSNQTHRNSVISTALRSFDRVIWKTTGGHKVPWPQNLADPIMCAMDRVECLDISWTLLLRPENYVDVLHYRPHVYNDIAVQIIRQLVSKQVIKYTALPAALHYRVVEVPHNETVLNYLVDPLGLLRRFTMPPTTIVTTAQAPCIEELRNRSVVQYTTSEAKKCVGGDTIDDICVYLKHEVRNGDLMRMDNSKTVYLIEKGVRREFTSFHAFVSRGYDFDNVKVVTVYEGDAFPLGEPLV